MEIESIRDVQLVRGFAVPATKESVALAFESTTEDQWADRPGIEPRWHLFVGDTSKPVKAVFRNLPGLPKGLTDFTTREARRVFHNLGFRTAEVDRPEHAALCLLGTWNEISEDALTAVRNVIDSKGAWASWWSFPISEEAQAKLELPFYLYLNSGGNRITHRATIEEFRTSSGNSGIKTPWPDITDADLIAETRVGLKTSEIFKTWLKISDVEQLVSPLSREDFTPALGTGMASLLNQASFGYAYPKASSDAERTRQSASALDGTIRSSLEQVMATYVPTRTNEVFVGRHSVAGLFDEIARVLERAPAVRRRSTIAVTWSAGKGNWANVPWVALLDSRETHTTQHGVYCVFLFKQDMSGVYLTFNQGVTEPKKQFGRTEARRILAERAAQIRANAASLQSHGFSLDDRIDLNVDRGLGIDYEQSTIAYKLYRAGHVPNDDVVLDDVAAVLETYDNYVTDRPSAQGTPGRKYWIFQANPTIFDISAATTHLNELTWLTTQHRDEIRLGDSVYLWQSGPGGGIVATGEIVEPPTVRELAPDELQYTLAPDKLSGNQHRARLKIERRLSPTFLRRELLDIPGLRELSILRAPQGTNFPVTSAEAEILDNLLAKPRAIDVPPRLDLCAVHQSFVDSLRTSSLFFGASHDVFTRSFVASLATKRFLILTGLSGSGKTQIALRFGNWCGAEKMLLVPVRPDWTGAEAVFGYEDALLPVVDGRRAWHVPEPLEFMLTAAADPSRPHVLVLDEMNLAHVERYFADVLSGMESNEECIPNLVKEGAVWYPARESPARIRFPDNLFIIGTVNVDETTYMFSPKVLDRANTIEFRVTAADLTADARKPTQGTPGADDLVRGFLAIARDDEFHISFPHPECAKIESTLKGLHGQLAEGGFEFGHRVYYEIIRFAAMYKAAGVDDWESAADLQIMQKILPRLHGSRRRLEPVLTAIARFCTDVNNDRVLDRTSAGQQKEVDHQSAPTRFPRTLEKVTRMLQGARANQFASFTD